MIKNKALFIRRTHRYLGLFIGIQFLGWTISGLYFSWNSIDNVHGDHMRKNPHFISVNSSLVSPEGSIQQLRQAAKVDSIHSIQLISILGKPVYQILYFSGHTGDLHHHHVHYKLADAVTGELRDPLTKDEAIEIARDNIISTAKLSEVILVENSNGHHEYRERPLPAYAVSFEDPNCTVYISTEAGTFQTIRHNQWRAFDFLWMFHTMDYAGRDNFNNWLLRTLSVFGLLTVMSGFLLYVTSSRTLKKAFNK
jgi:uncharacterized iron-regulated membrane protein